jgi:hypothetical protein
MNSVSAKILTQDTHCYILVPRVKVFAIPYRTEHFLSSISSECIQFWSFFRGIIVRRLRQGSAGSPNPCIGYLAIINPAISVHSRCMLFCTFIHGVRRPKILQVKCVGRGYPIYTEVSLVLRAVEQIRSSYCWCFHSMIYMASFHTGTPEQDFDQTSCLKIVLYCKFCSALDSNNGLLLLAR